MKPIILASLFSLTYLVASAQKQIAIPKTNDKYAVFVKQLEAGQTDIDYKEFRFSYLNRKSNSYHSHLGSYDSLKKEMFKQAHEKKNYNEAVNICKQMLSIDYTSLYGQKYLYQTYKILGDTTNANKYHTIEMGLLKSIVSTGNGRSASSSWEVINIEEEYFILNMLGAKLKQQTLDDSGGVICDKMNVISEGGEEKDYYFNVEKLMQKEQELFKK